MAFFASDNTSYVCAEVMDAIAHANTGSVKAYGADAYTEAMQADFSRVFERSDLAVFPTFNGSAANCTALAAIMKPHEAIIAHKHSHIEQDECGMPEFFTGAKILTVGGDHGKIDLNEAEAFIHRAQAGGMHHVRPRVISITQSTEFGTVYTAEEIATISAFARSHGLLLHMDGARFANAAAHLGCRAADISWRAGVDVMSFGGTKNGAMIAEAIVFFDAAMATDMPHIRKRAGQLASKQRYIAVQLSALLQNDLWLEKATHANRMASLLAEGLRAHPHATPVNAVEANSLFVHMPRAMAEHLHAADHYFYHWPTLGDGTYRLVTSIATSEDEVRQFIRDAASWQG